MVETPPVAESTSSAPPPPRRHRWAKRLALLVFGGIAGLLLAEGALRVLGVGYPLPYRPDDACGTVLAPNFSGYFSQEGGAAVTTNSHGMRDLEYPLAKPEGTYRIAVLGDSYAEALQVDAGETFWAVLERELAGDEAFAGKTVEVLNFGVSGYGTAQELQMLRTRVWPFEPDLVLLAFTTGNDIRNNSKILETDDNRPFFLPEGDVLKLDTSFLQHPDQLKARSESTQQKVRWINRSRVLQVVNRWMNSEAAARKNNSGDDLEEAGLDIGQYYPPSDAIWEQAWEITEKILALMHEEAKEHGAKFCIVTLTNGIQVRPDPAFREKFRRRYINPDLTYPDRRIKAAGERIGFPVLTLVEPMQKMADEEKIYFHGFENTTLGTGHWNELGHRTAGELMAEFVVKEVVD